MLRWGSTAEVVREHDSPPPTPGAEKHRAPSTDAPEGPESEAFIHWRSSHWLRAVPWRLPP